MQQLAEQPYFIGTLTSAVTSLGMRPYLLTGLFVDWMRRHFVDASFIEEPDLRKLLWQGVDATSILIESLEKWDPTTTETRPAVIVKQNDYQNVRYGINDRLQGPSVDRQGNEHYSSYWVGSHTLFCLGGPGLQASLLGTEVQRELLQFGPQIARQLNLKKFHVQALGGPILLEEAQQDFAVPVTVGVVYEEKWMLRVDALPLRQIVLSTLLS